MLHRMPVPGPSVEVTDEYIVRSLPSLEETLQQLGFMYILTNDELLYLNTFIDTPYREHETETPMDPDYLVHVYGFALPALVDRVKDFTAGLALIETATRQRQQTRIVEFRKVFGPRPLVPITVEYPYLLPSRVNLSITN